MRKGSVKKAKTKRDQFKLYNTEKQLLNII